MRRPYSRRRVQNIVACIGICFAFFFTSYCYTSRHRVQKCRLHPQHVRILLCMCPHTTMCVLILLYMCPHTSLYVSSYYYIYVLMLLYICPHAALYVSAYYYIAAAARGCVFFFIVFFCLFPMPIHAIYI